MTSIRKFVYGALLAATTISIAPTLASAAEPARGRFTLTHEVHWGTAKLPAGEYEFSFNVEGVSPVLMLSKLTGARAGYMILVPTTEETYSSDASRLELETTASGSYVSAMRLPEFGMTLHFDVPAHPAEKLAKATTIASAAGQ